MARFIINGTRRVITNQDVWRVKIEDTKTNKTYWLTDDYLGKEIFDLLNELGG